MSPTAAEQHQPARLVARSTGAAITKAAQDILDRGYCVVKLSDVDTANLHHAIDTAVEFFGRPVADKSAHGSQDHNYGYRPFGVEYSASPDRPDMNECFTVWSSRLDLIPNAQDIPELTGAFLSWRDSLAPLVAGIVDEVARNFGTDAAPEFEKASYLQINFCLPTPAERDLLQDKHEDGHMVTVLHSTAPGLEIYTNDGVKPVTPAHDEVVIMPGSVLTALSAARSNRCTTRSATTVSTTVSRSCTSSTRRSTSRCSVGSSPATVNSPTSASTCRTRRRCSVCRLSRRSDLVELRQRRAAGGFLRRDDPRSDALFYELPRLVTHIDDGAIAAVGELYAELGVDGSAAAPSHVLDLMSSWVSHLRVRPARLTVLGMNAVELAANPMADERVVQDLNADPALPFADASFDAVLCCVSVDYLTRPVEVLRDCARVLRPGGPVVITFANRCFPTKAVHGWLATDDAGHVGVVLDYLRRAGGFDVPQASLRTPRVATGAAPIAATRCTPSSPAARADGRSVGRSGGRLRRL